MRTEQGGGLYHAEEKKESMPRGGGGLIEISVWICGYGSDGSQYSYSGYSNELMARRFSVQTAMRVLVYTTLGEG